MFIFLYFFKEQKAHYCPNTTSKCWQLSYFSNRFTSISINQNDSITHLRQALLLQAGVVVIPNRGAAKKRFIFIQVSQQLE